MKTLCFDRIAEYLKIWKFFIQEIFSAVKILKMLLTWTRKHHLAVLF